MAVTKIWAITDSFSRVLSYAANPDKTIYSDICKALHYANKLGVELAKRMWGDQYQVLVATHFNTGTYHNHLVINSVNMWNGKKFNCNEGAYWKLRSISDELCKENGLTVIKNPNGNGSWRRIGVS